MEGKIHEGRNLKRIREILGIKQDSLAIDLGDDWNQKRISLLEQKESIEPGILEEVAKALKVPVESIKNFNEDATVNIIASNNNGKDNSAAVNFQCTFNPVERWMEALDKIEKLYERLVQVEREKAALLENVIVKNKT
jgi:transcriptional regulator with XRE-family HTH domain